VIQTAADIIYQYIKENLFDAPASWPKQEIEKRSYQQWAAYEIVNRILDHPLDMPIDTIDSFMYEMAMYACYGEDEHRSRIFQIAVETAEDVALLFV